MKNTEEKLNFDKVWQMFQETNAKFQETDKAIKELAEEHKKSELAQQETWKQIKAVNKNLGGIGTANGDVAESLIINTLEKSLSLNGWKFDSFQADVNKKDKKLKLEEQYDLMLEKEDLIALVEIKYRLKIEDLRKIQNKKLPNFRKLFPFYNHKKLFGVAATLSTDKKTLKEASNLGIYVITLKAGEIKVLNKDYKEFE